MTLNRFKHSLLICGSVFVLASITQTPLMASEKKDKEIIEDVIKINKSGFRETTEKELNKLGYNLKINPIELQQTLNGNGEEKPNTKGWQKTIDGSQDFFKGFVAYVKKKSGLENVETVDTKSLIGSISDEKVTYPTLTTTLWKKEESTLDSENKEIKNSLNISIESQNKKITDSLIEYLVGKYGQYKDTNDMNKSFMGDTSKEIETLKRSIHQESQLAYHFLLQTRGACLFVFDEINKLINKSNEIKERNTKKTTAEGIYNKVDTHTKEEKEAYNEKISRYTKELKNKTTEAEKIINNLNTFIDLYNKVVVMPGKTDYGYFGSISNYFRGHPRVNGDLELRKNITTDHVKLVYEEIVNGIRLDNKLVKDFTEFNTLHSLIFGEKTTLPFKDESDYNNGVFSYAYHHTVEYPVNFIEGSLNITEKDIKGFKSGDIKSGLSKINEVIELNKDKKGEDVINFVKKLENTKVLLENAQKNVSNESDNEEEKKN